MDLIDRQALLKQIDIDSDGEPGYYGDTWKFIDTIKNLPSATEHGTNLAEAGTDLISRQQAITALAYAKETGTMKCGELKGVIEVLNKVPSAQPEIIRCCECKYLQCNMRPDGYLPKGVDEFECRHWCGSCDPMDFCSCAERRTE